MRYIFDTSSSKFNKRTNCFVIVASKAFMNLGFDIDGDYWPTNPLPPIHLYEIWNILLFMNTNTLLKNKVWRYNIFVLFKNST